MTQHLRAECGLILTILFRQPGFWVPTVLFPAMLYAFFGAQSGGGSWAANAMASFAIYAVLGVGFFQFGVSVAQDRESTFATWQRSLPGHSANRWIARMVASLVFVSMAVCFVIAVALLMTDFVLSASAWARLVLVCLLATIPATVMGIALGSVASARAAVPIANLIFLPLAYLGGLWVPPMFMPAPIAAISEWTPTRAMGELAWAAINDTAWKPQQLFTLMGWTLFAAAVIFVSLRYANRQ
ncbi:ABC transporter permease [Phaeobacter sp. B1627]|uniref:ABC transporter permease n=1 Tax=Phaeobacter sp. B1627 TaxID=2583809 RepID=UPI001118E9E4|nr:ABC transporter permease [Phaeobacter sp. B1627]TNJ39150.1 ABC transporter permease [Phaeobacter sp. B1627]